MHSYVSAVFDNKMIHVWYRDTDNKLHHDHHKPEWYLYEKLDSITDDLDEYESEIYRDMFQNELRRRNFKNRKELKAYTQSGNYYNNSGHSISTSIYESLSDEDREQYHIEQKPDIYESDIQPELKYLSDTFYNVKHRTLNMTGYDIECDYDPEIGFSRPIEHFKPEDYRGNYTRKANTPYAPINSISIYNFWENKNYLIAVPPVGLDANDIDVDEFMSIIEDIEPLDLPTSLEFVNTEAELLLRFLDIIEDSDLIFGWNSDTFDNPYIAQRIQIVLDTEYDSRSVDGFGYQVVGRHFRRLSFEFAPHPRYGTVEKFGEDAPVIEFFGRTATDYLELYKKFSFGEKPSYKLESIAEEELPNMRKLEYDGTLYELYRNNFPKFVRYNIRDTEILFGFEEKLGFIELANTMYHNTTGLFKHVFGTLKNTELAIINFCHHELDNIKVQDNYYVSTSESIEGAYVLPTVPGQHNWMSSIDIESLYPSGIRSNNISPDTIIGQFQNNKRDFELIKRRSDEPITLFIDKTFNSIPDSFYGTLSIFDVEDWPNVSLEIKNSASHYVTLQAKQWIIFFRLYKWSISGYGTVFNQNKKGILPALLESWFIERKKTKKLSFDYAKKAEAILDKYR